MASAARACLTNSQICGNTILISFFGISCSRPHFDQHVASTFEAPQRQILPATLNISALISNGKEGLLEFVISTGLERGIHDASRC
jgi:hypothetical protein